MGVDGEDLHKLVCFDLVCNECMSYLDVTDFCKLAVWLEILCWYSFCYF